MEALFEYRIPVWHPIAVHFPPALLLVSAGAAAGWIAWGGAAWRRALAALLALSALGTTFAYFTGEAMARRSEGVPIVEELVNLHAQLALYTLVGTGLALAGAIGALVWSRRSGCNAPRWVRFAVGFIVLAAAALVLATAHLGGTMTWGVPE
jgi:uncharacterized membrane protein